MQVPGDSQDEIEEEDAIGANAYGIWSGIAGILMGLGLIAFMFALADGFS